MSTAWLTDPDDYECRTAVPEATAADRAAIRARVQVHAAPRPKMLLPLMATWLSVVFVLQVALRQDIWIVAELLEAVGILGCAVGMYGLRTGRLSSERIWQLVNVVRLIQLVTLTIGYFETHLAAYQTAIVLQILSASMLDIRARAVQLGSAVLVVTWLLGLAISPATSGMYPNLAVVLAACSAALVGHRVTMRAIYVTKWLRTVDERRTAKLSAALAESQEQLEQRQRAELTLANTLTELQQAHGQLLQAHKLEAIGQLAAGIAHEINTPTQFVSDNTAFLQTAFDKLLAALAACQTLLADDTREEAEPARRALEKARIAYHSKQVPRAIEQSLDGLRRIASLVAALKEFSHPSAGVKTPVQLNSTLQTTIEIARNEWKYVANLTTELDPELPEVSCLADELNQVFLNLIVNAAHAITERAKEGELGSIVIRTRSAGDHAIIEVTDDGAGIPEAIRHRIFEPFFTTKEVGKGTGQGLAISYSVIVDKHGGSLAVSSEVGRGTTFTVRLPIREPVAVALAA